MATSRARKRRPSPAKGAGSARYLVHVVPGLEEVAADEIAESLPDAGRGGAWKQFDERTSLLEYRAPGGGQARRWLDLATAEDVFVLVAQGRSLRADRAGLGDLAAATLTTRHLDDALDTFAACRRKAPKTFRVVARKSGTHAYRRVDAQRTVERALQARLPKARLVEDDADAEFWLTVIGDTALIGLRLSTPRMRGGAGTESIPASLKPTVARAMVRLSRPRESDVVLDPFCGAGTLLLERGRTAGYAALQGGDRDPAALAKARANARASGIPLELQEWDALSLPLPDASVDVILTNPPFGKKVKIRGGDPDAFYRRCVAEMRRVLQPGGRLVLVTSQADAFLSAARELPSPLAVRKRLPVLVRGERATIFVAEATVTDRS